jgi:hypothetical protein
VQKLDARWKRLLGTRRVEIGGSLDLDPLVGHALDELGWKLAR